jgi:alpha-amylase
VEREEELDIELRDPSLYHRRGSIENYRDRWEITQRKLGSLPDLKTQDQRVQDMHARFLNKCVALGTDGFRFDAAKHIETSRGEDKEWAGDYWEDVLHQLRNRENLYLFGEVLQDRGDNLNVYLSYYDVTCHNYGSVLRDAILKRDVRILEGHEERLSGIGRNHCLAYVENHDDYEHDKSRHMKYWERKVANAFLIARAGLVPRVMDRPEDDLWEDPDIVAVNHLRNTVVGTEEHLRFPSKHVAVVERGKNAVVIINVGHETQLDVETGLNNGSYDNRATIPTTLLAKNGRLEGRFAGGAVFVGHKSTDNAGVKTVFRAKYDVGWGHDLYIRGDMMPLSWSKGIKMRWMDGNVWIWETHAYPANTEIAFKVLIDDERWEIIGDQPFKNHEAESGKVMEITPIFPE